MSSSLTNLKQEETLQAALETSHNLDFAITGLLEKLAMMVSARGYQVKPYTVRSLGRLPGLPLAKKESLLEQLQVTIKILVVGTETEKILPTVEYPERRLVEQALEFYGYELRDQDFWTRVRREELVEIYNASNIQIFRTFNFFKTSSYSILDLLINEWYHLWERPSWTLDIMLKLGADTFAGLKKGIHPAGVPEHVINEIFNNEDQGAFVSRSSLCNFGIVCPVYNKADGQIGGLLITAQVTPIVLGQQARNISFI